MTSAHLESEGYAARQVHDTPEPKLEVEEHRIHSLRCDSGAVTEAGKTVPLAQLGDVQRDRADPRVPVARTIAVPRGLALGDGKPKNGAHGNPVLFLHPKDFDGALIELEEVR